MGPDHPCEEAILRGKGQHIVNYMDSLPSVSCAKNGCTNRDAVWHTESGHVGPGNHVLDVVQMPPLKGGTFVSVWRIEKQKHCKA